MDTQTQTPGPWMVAEYAQDLEIWPESGHKVGNRIAKLDARTQFGWERPRAEANARLIASAPALLAALEAILPLARAKEREQRFDQGYIARFRAVDEAQAAIAQAKGGA